MAVFSIENVQLKGIAATIPKTKVSNFDLQHFEKEELQKLISTIGIENRRIADDSTCASDLCLNAAEKLITELNWEKADIELLIFVTQTPDYQLPGTSLHLQERLGLPKTCITFDINQGCAGYVYGLSIISSFMCASKIKKGILLVGDTITKLISKNDKSIGPIFSDCGTASAFEYNKNAHPIHFNISSEGKDFDAIIVKDGGSRNTNGKEKALVMKGLDVFNFSIKKVVPNIEELLLKINVPKNEIDYFVFHQANKLILESIANKLFISLEKTPSTLKNYGNTSGATIPLTIVDTLKNKIYNKNLLLSGFGVGLSLASALIKTEDVVCCDISEI